jgi:hypothetical protein
VRWLGWRQTNRLVNIMQDTYWKSEGMHFVWAVRTGVATLCLLVLCHTCRASTPSYISDRELADLPIIVVARWDKAKMDVHVHTSNEAGSGEVVDHYEVRTKLVIDRVLKGNIALGKHKLLFGFGVGWYKDGRGVSSASSTEIPGEVDDVTKPTLWFLSSEHSWDETDKTTYLRVMTYRCIQPLALEPYYRTLLRPDREIAIAHLLDSADKQIVARCLRFINGDRAPWPLTSFVYMANPKPKPKPLAQHAARIAATLNHMIESERPYASAVYASLLGPDSVKEMRRLLSDRNPMVRAISVGVLARFHDTSSVESFHTALTGFVDGPVSCAIIAQLEAWGDERLVPALIGFLQDDSDGGMLDDLMSVPALNARRALLKMTGYGFPFDVHTSLVCWNAARQINEPVRRKQYLIQHLGSDKPPFQAQVVGSNHFTIVVTNVSDRTIKIEQRPDWIIAELSDGSWTSSTPGDLGKSASFVSLLPGGSIRIALDLDDRFILADPKSRSLQLLYLQNGDKQGRNAWIGTLSPTFGP